MIVFGIQMDVCLLVLVFTLARFDWFLWESPGLDGLIGRRGEESVFGRGEGFDAGRVARQPLHALEGR